MRINLDGRTWIVEERELPEGLVRAGGRFSGVTFRDAERAGDALHVRWIRRPQPLTPRLARELFQLAGVRFWRDPRDGRSYRIRIETASSRAHRLAARAPLESVRFEADGVEVHASWTLDRPLGLASDRELMMLLDRALRDASLEALPTD